MKKTNKFFAIIAAAVIPFCFTAVHVHAESPDDDFDGFVPVDISTPVEPASAPEAVPEVVEYVAPEATPAPEAVPEVVEYVVPEVAPTPEPAPEEFVAPATNPEEMYGRDTEAEVVAEWSGSKVIEDPQPTEKEPEPTPTPTPTPAPAPTPTPTPTSTPTPEPKLSTPEPTPTVEPTVEPVQQVVREPKGIPNTADAAGYEQFVALRNFLASMSVLLVTAFLLVATRQKAVTTSHGQKVNWRL